MSISNGYLTLDQIKAYIGDGISGARHELMLEEAVESASRWIDRHCGRRFYADGSATARTYYPTTAYLVDVDDISTTTGLVVKKDTADDGTFDTTITSSDYQLEPLGGVMDGQSGWPYTRIRLVESVTFPTSGKRPSVEITADWGWAAVPDDVEQACRVLSHHFFELRNAPHGVAGFGAEGFAVRASAVPPQVTSLLMPYRKGTRQALAFAL